MAIIVECEVKGISRETQPDAEPLMFLDCSSDIQRCFKQDISLIESIFDTLILSDTMKLCHNSIESIRIRIYNVDANVDHIIRRSIQSES